VNLFKKAIENELLCATPEINPEDWKYNDVISNSEHFLLTWQNMHTMMLTEEMSMKIHEAMLRVTEVNVRTRVQS